ncbi:MAG: hypothetical protein HC880_01940 [Bacteroidia bacterium]|nr:hypothetical protein [Bacteroidia bacterium]
MKISNGEVVRIAQENNGRLTPQLLSEKTDLTRSEASRKLYLMLSEGVFRYEYDDNYLPVFALSNVVKRALESAGDPSFNYSYVAAKLSDREVISIALEAGGKISVTSLCVKGNVSVDDARNILERLQTKGVFDIEVKDNGSIIYVLNDQDLLK